MPIKKIENMTPEELLAEIERNEKKREDLFKQKEPIDNKLTWLYNRNSKLREQSDKIKAEKIKSGRIDWDWVLDGGFNDSHEKSSFRQEQLQSIGLLGAGFYPEINQAAIRVKLIRNDPQSLEDTIAGLRKILKYIRPLSQYNMKHIGIFEHTLNQYGVYFMTIDEDKGVYQIRKTTYGRTEILHKFKTLRKMLEYVQDRYYYEDEIYEDAIQDEDEW